MFRKQAKSATMLTMLSAIWRVLISAIVILCTLPTLNASGHRLDRIKDLICVLYFSGLQKEDLDLSILTRLQRYNVNFDDVNNEELRNICLTQESNPTPETISKDNPSIKVPDFIKSLNTNIPSYETPKYGSTMPETFDRFYPIKYTNGQPNIESVVNFWKHAIQPKDPLNGTRTTEIHKIISRRAKEDFKTNIPNNVQFSMDLNETELIKKILLNRFVSQSGNEPTQVKLEPEQVSNRNYNLNADSFSRSSGTFPSNLPLTITMNEMPFSITALRSHEIDKHDARQESFPMVQKLDTILKTINQFKDMFSELNHNKRNDPVHYPNPEPKSMQKENMSPVMTQQAQLTPALNFTDNLVNKIAQSVKDMVLHDLRNEMQASSTTTRTDESQKIILKKNNQAFKVLDIFQAFKKPDPNTIVFGLSNKIPRQQYYDSPPKPEMTNFQQPYNFHPQIHKMKTEPPNTHKKKLAPKPITVQTNLLEIPPLGIPITQHQNPINQNIIVTTVIPFKMNYDSDNGQSFGDSALMKVYSKDVFQSPLSAKFSKRSDDCPLNHPCNHKKEDIIRFRLSNDGKTKYDTDYYEKINLGKMKATSNLEKEPLQPFHERLERIGDRYEAVDVNEDCCNTKFPMTQQMMDCCNEKIASRQQMSIGTMKRASYDDTHFRNFLKTQQKVTDMLEQILATKTRPELFHSVETT